MDENLFDRDKFEELKNNTSLMNDNLMKAFQQGKEFLDLLVETKLWTGQSKDEFQCYFHLVMQYNGQLVGEKVPSVGIISSAKVKGKPCEIVLDTLKDFNRSMDQFTGNCGSYQELEKI